MAEKERIQVIIKTDFFAYTCPKCGRKMETFCILFSLSIEKTESECECGHKIAHSIY